MWRLRRRVVCVFFWGFGVGTFFFLSFVGWVDGLGFPLFWCIIYSCLLDGGIAHSLCIVLRLAFIFGLVHLISLDAVQSLKCQNLPNINIPRASTEANFWAETRLQNRAERFRHLLE